MLRKGLAEHPADELRHALLATRVVEGYKDVSERTVPAFLERGLCDDPLDRAAFGEQVDAFDIVLLGGLDGDGRLVNSEPYEMSLDVFAVDEASVPLILTRSLYLDKHDRADMLATRLEMPRG